MHEFFSHGNKKALGWELASCIFVDLCPMEKNEAVVVTCINFWPKGTNEELEMEDGIMYMCKFLSQGNKGTNECGG